MIDGKIVDTVNKADVTADEVLGMIIHRDVRDPRPASTRDSDRYRDGALVDDAVGVHAGVAVDEYRRVGPDYEGHPGKHDHQQAKGAWSRAPVSSPLDHAAAGAGMCAVAAKRVVRVGRHYRVHATVESCAR